MIGNVIDSLFLVQLDYPAAAACSVMLMLAIVAAGAGLRAPRRHGGAAVTVDAARSAAGSATTLVHGWSRSLVLLYMFLPIFFVVLMSFNDPASRLSYEFDGVHAGQLDRPVRAERHVRLGGDQPADRLPGHARRDRSSAPWSRSRWCGTGSAAGRRPAC